ncbi:MAG: hypothetical protein ABIR57_00520, partial [Aeromicrobium sp.]
GLAYKRFAPASLSGSTLWSVIYVGGGTAVASVIDRTSSILGQATWLFFVAGAMVAVPTLIVRQFSGMRPVVATRDLAFYEDRRPAHRRAAFSPLIGDFQV